MVPVLTDLSAKSMISSVHDCKVTEMAGMTVIVDQ